MSKRDWFILVVAGLFIAFFLPHPARASEKSETVQQMEIMRDIVQAQSKSIEALAGALKTAVERPPVIIGQPQMFNAAAPVEKDCSGFWGCSLEFVGGSLKAIASFADRNAVPLAQLVLSDRAAKRQATSAENIALYTNQTHQAAFNSIAHVGATGITGIRDTAGMGFNALATVGSQPNNVYTVSGNGNNFGSGPLTYAPITNSNNPVNPLPNQRLCAIVNNSLVCY